MHYERTEEEALERVTSGATWAEFCDALKLAGSLLERDGTPKDPLTLAEGLRYLARLTRAGLQTFVEGADPRAPVLQRAVHETAKMGSDNPDNYYQNASISGEYEYRITGTRGTVHYLGFATQIGHYGQGRGMPPSGHLEASEMLIGDDGRFEIIVSCNDPGPGKNWLRMVPETGTLIVRQTFLDRAGEQLAELDIERIGGQTRPGPLTPRDMDRALQSAGMLVGGAAAIFANWAEGFTEHVNELPQFSPELSTSFGGDPNIAYYHSYWRLGPDEALVIDAAPPECQSWNFQLNNHWMESLDYRFFQITLNKHTARPRPDGSVRLVVAHDDPGVDNWITTAGHDFGTMCFRWIRATEHPQPKTRVVKLSAVKELAPL